MLLLPKHPAICDLLPLTLKYSQLNRGQWKYGPITLVPLSGWPLRVTEEHFQKTHNSQEGALSEVRVWRGRVGSGRNGVGFALVPCFDPFRKSSFNSKVEACEPHLLWMHREISRCLNIHYPYRLSCHPPSWDIPVRWCHTTTSPAAFLYLSLLLQPSSDTQLSWFKH